MDQQCQIITITGLPSQERTVFAYLMAQYLSHDGKTLILEKDFKYLTLSHIATKSAVAFLEISLEQMYRSPQETIKRISHTEEKLIVITCRKKKQHNYSFLCNLLVHNLSQQIDYFIMELELDEIPSAMDYITVLPNNLVDVLKTVEKMPDNYMNCSSFVGVNMRKLEELSILHQKSLEIIVCDLLQIMNQIEIPIFNLNSLKLGGEIHGLCMLFRH